MPPLEGTPRFDDPKWVISMGVCASSGGMFNNYAIVQGVDHIVPVDIYLPGCPPRPEMLLDSIVKLHDKIQNMKLGANREAEIDGAGARPARPAAGGTPAPPGTSPERPARVTAAGPASAEPIRRGPRRPAARRRRRLRSTRRPKPGAE